MNILKKTLLSMGCMFIATSAYGMQEEPIVANQIGSLEQAMLCQAIKVGNAPLVKGLFDRYPKINVNEKDHSGDSLLQLSVLAGSPEIMNLILTHPKFIIDQDELAHCLLAAIYFFYKNENEYVRSLYLKIAQALASHEKTNIHYQDPTTGLKPVIIAVYTKCYPVAKILIERHEIVDDKNIKQEPKQTPANAKL